MEALQAVGHTLSVWAIPVILAITLHEAAHGWAAERLGDDTARRMGRVTFNPIAHVDPLGTILLPAFLLFAGAPFLFGWAKPVPVAFHRLRNPKRDMIWVAVAGPGVNIALALVAAFVARLWGQLEANTFSLWVYENLNNAVIVNIVLAVFNMLPLPPLDGGRVVTGLLPLRLARRFARLEPYGIFILIGVAFLLPMLLREFGIAINPLAAILLPAIEIVYRLVNGLVGA
jgi:Zn-dependent protease